ncbi:MAG: nucleotide exchange factor GrpE [Phycisphaerales bacterium JB040]
MSTRPDDDYIDIPEIDEEPSFDDYDAGEEPDAPGTPRRDEGADGARDAERLKQLQQMATEGSLEAPAGADEIVEALRLAVTERDEMFAKLQRLAADHQNFQRRARLNEQEAQDQAKRGILQSIIPVLDQFELALNQKTEGVAPESILGGVKLIQTEFLRILGNCGVTTIAPSPGDEFDPLRHEAMLQQPAEGVEPGHVTQCLGVGYALGDRTVRPAKVAVAPSS